MSNRKININISFCVDDPMLIIIQTLYIIAFKFIIFVLPVIFSLISGDMNAQYLGFVYTNPVLAILSKLLFVYLNIQNLYFVF
jgi:hypothetical protein